MRACRSKDTRRRAPQRAGERELALVPLFICFSLPGPVLCKLGQPGVLFVYLRSSLWSSDLPLFYFRGLFSSLSFSHHHFELLLPGGSDGKASACSAGDLGSIPGLGRSPGEVNGSPLQYSCLENPYQAPLSMGLQRVGHN